MRAFLVDALAAYRLTMLATRDDLTEPLRGLVDERRHPVLADFVECPWCVGMYVAGLVVVARRIAPRWWGPVATALAYSGVTGFLAEH